MLTLDDNLTAWNDPGSYSFFSVDDIAPLPSDIFTPAPTGNVAAPNDTLAGNLGKGLASIGKATFDFVSKSADLFATGLGVYAQGKKAYDTIVSPNSPKPAQTVANSQLPSLQGSQDNGQLYQSMLNLRAALNKVFVPSGADTLNQPAVSTPQISFLLIAAVLVLGFFIVRAE